MHGSGVPSSGKFWIFGSLDHFRRNFSYYMYSSIINYSKMNMPDITIIAQLHADLKDSYRKLTKLGGSGGMPRRKKIGSLWLNFSSLVINYSKLTTYLSFYMSVSILLSTKSQGGKFPPSPQCRIGHTLASILAHWKIHLFTRPEINSSRLKSYLQLDAIL